MSLFWTNLATSELSPGSYWTVYITFWNTRSSTTTSLVYSVEVHLTVMIILISWFTGNLYYSDFGTITSMVISSPLYFTTV